MGAVFSFLLSPGWGRHEPFLGQIHGNQIKMRVRHANSNGLTRFLYGSVEPSGTGSRLDLRFRTLWWVEALLRATWVGLAVPVVYVLLETLVGQGAGEVGEWQEALTGLGVLVFMIAFLLGVELFARWMGDRDEGRIREHILGLFEDVMDDPASDARG